MENKKILLSFCIPTYRRDFELRQLLDSIVEAVKPMLDKSLIEVCIADNNIESEGETQRMVESYSDQFKIHYQMNEANLGANRNMVESLRLASGQYLWLLGSDDILVENAIQHMIERFSSESNVDLYVLNRFIGDEKANPLKPDNYWGDGGDTSFNYGSITQRLDYLKSAKTVDALGCFFSSLIFSRRYFEIYAQESMGCAFLTSNIWGYLGVLHQAAHKTNPLIWRYVSTPLVVWRSGNNHLGGGAEIVKMCHMISLLDQIKVDGKTRRSMKSIARSHYAIANTITYFERFGRPCDAFLKIPFNWLKNSILLPLNLAIAYRGQLPASLNKFVKRLSRFAQRFTD